MNIEMRVILNKSCLFFLTFLSLNGSLYALAHVRFAKLPLDQDMLPVQFNQDLPTSINYLAIHRNLAETQTNALRLFKTNTAQNLVVASVTVIVKNLEDNQVSSQTFPLGYVFESRIDYSKDLSKIFINQDDAQSFSHQFEQDVISFAELVKHLNDCIGTQKSRQAHMILQEISRLYDEEREFSILVQNMHFFMSKALTHLLPYSDDLPQMRVESQRKGLFTQPNQRQISGIQSEHEHRNGAISKLKATFNKGIKDIEDFQRPMRDQLVAFYNKFWHSEQRCIYHLLNSQHDDESNNHSAINIHAAINAHLDNLTADQQITGVVIHLHSSYQPCPVCNYLIGASVANLRKKFTGDLTQDHMDNQNFLKVTITYNTSYRPENFWLVSFAFDGEYSDAEDNT